MAKRRKSLKKHLKKNPIVIWLGAILMVCLLFLGVFYYQNMTSQVSATTNTSQSDSQEEIRLAFIKSIASSASIIAGENDLYASVMIAQAILESNSGQSTLSQAPNYNLFGIKGTYNGNSVTMQTWEDDGSGNAYTIDAQFRAYPNQAASLQDYADFLNRDLYAGVHKSHAATYEDATAALTGTYATDTSYGDKLNSLIERYSLTLYDTW